MSHRKIQLIATGLFVAVFLLPLRSSASLGDCGQPFTTGTNPVATDARRILTTGVGSTTCSDTFDACICDVNNNGAVNATDALLTLQKGVGQPVVLDCGPNCPPTTTTTMGVTTTTTTIGTTTTTTLPTGPACSSAELIATSGGKLDSGWAGPGLNQDLISGARITVDVLRRCTTAQTVCKSDADCTGGDTCDLTCNCDDPGNSTCEITGPTHEKRCLVSMDPCTSDAQCAGAAGGSCVRFFGGPLPLAAAGTPVCVTTFFQTDITGTADSFSGEAVASVNLRSRVHATNITNPCPVCSTPTGKLGSTGTCAGDSPNVGLPCTVESISPDFGPTSGDCPPKASQNVSGLGLAIPFREVSTGTVSKTAKLTCPGLPFNPGGPVGGVCSDTLASAPQSCASNADCTRCTSDLSACTTNADCTAGSTCASAPAQPISCGFYCYVGFCRAAGGAVGTENPDAPCMDDGDCGAGEICVLGTGSDTSANGPQDKPNGCSNNICGTVNPEQCDPSDTLGVCDVKDFIPCSTDSQCSQQGAGTKCNFIPKPCFENTVSRTGSPSPLGSFCADDDPAIACASNADCNGTVCRSDTSVPDLVGIFPIQATSSAAVNGAAGIAGPGAILFKQVAKVCRCGDGAVGCDEQCDDGNNTNGDGCSSVCTTEP